jgi:cell division septum initiation protein DivIVA
MSDEPWRIFYEKDIAPYSILLLEIHRSIDTRKIQLKDSDRVLQYLQTILESLPDLQHKAHAFKTDVDLVRHHNTDVIYKVKELEEKIMQHTEALARSRQNLEQHRRQAGNKKKEVDVILREAADTLAELTDRKYSLKYP